MPDKLLLSTYPFNCKCGNDLFEAVEDDTQFECSMCKARYWQKDGKLVEEQMTFIPGVQGFDAEVP